MYVISRKLRAVSVPAVVVLASLALCAQVAVAESLSLAGDPGAVFDPVGDATIYPGLGTVDLTGASVVAFGNTTRVRVTTADPLRSDALFAFCFDTDKNRNTGYFSAGSPWNGYEREAYVYYSGYPNKWGVTLWDQNSNWVDHQQVTVYDNGFEFWTTQLGASTPDGTLSYTVQSALYLSGGGTTPVLDGIPTWSDPDWVSSAVAPVPLPSAVWAGMSLLGGMGAVARVRSKFGRR